jgi:hypothetical protein
MTIGSDAESHGQTATPYEPSAEGGSRSDRDRAYALFLRGLDVEAIARELGAESPDVASWVADSATRGFEGGDPKRAQAGDTLRLLKRKLFAVMDQADVAAKPRFASAIAQIESRLVQLDGRCGSRLREKPGRYCQRYPEPQRSRCRLHGGASPVGPLHPSFIHGGRSSYPLSVDERALADQLRPLAHDLTDEIAIAKVLYRRRVAEGATATTELNALTAAVRTLADIVKGNKIVFVPDEAAITRFTDVLMSVTERRIDEAIEKRLTGAKTRELIASDLMATNWTTLALPAPRIPLPI